MSWQVDYFNEIQYFEKRNHTEIIPAMFGYKCACGVRQGVVQRILDATL